jgi:hypothetical protein
MATPQAPAPRVPFRSAALRVRRRDRGMSASGAGLCPLAEPPLACPEPTADRGEPPLRSAAAGAALYLIPLQFLTFRSR